MKCDFCGNRDGGCEFMLKNTSFFCIHLRTKFGEYSNLPCYVREQIRKHTNGVLPVKTLDGDMYMFELIYMDKKTRILGEEYNKFLNDYNMQYAEAIRFELKRHNPYYLTVIPLDKNDHRKQKVEEEQHDYLSEASIVVYSGGLNPNKTQELNIRQCIAERGTGLGPVYVHCLTTTDVKNNGLRIPKLVVSYMPIPPRGDAYLVNWQDKKTKAVYYPSTDGRVRFKQGWTKFAKANRLTSGQTVLIMFNWKRNMLYVSFDSVD